MKDNLWREETELLNLRISKLIGNESLLKLELDTKDQVFSKLISLPNPSPLPSLTWEHVDRKSLMVPNSWQDWDVWKIFSECCCHHLDHV